MSSWSASSRAATTALGAGARSVEGAGADPPPWLGQTRDAISADSGSRRDQPARFARLTPCGMLRGRPADPLLNPKHADAKHHLTPLTYRDFLWVEYRTRSRLL